ncbi:MAG TPA: hypothetical protein PLQ00_04970, partial [Thermoguttaceae bacterium]|nr:hypothetical protein [Thermoguttaceae bacterium]
MMRLGFTRERTSAADPVGQSRSLTPEQIEAEFQKLKTRIHRELIESLDLSKLAAMEEARLRAHVRNLAEALLRAQPNLAAGIDEDRLLEELMAESFGLGPLEPYM